MHALKPLLIAIGFYSWCLPQASSSRLWATSLWPVPGTRLLYVFIAAIVAGGAAPLIWIGLSERFAGSAGYGLSFGMALASPVFYLRLQQPALLGFTFIIGLATVLCAILTCARPR